jgi:hypothetical protein
MLYFDKIFLLSLFFIYSISNDIQKYYPNRTIVPSRSIYDLVQIRRAAARFAAYRNRTHRNNNTNNFYQLANKVLNKNTYASRIKTSHLKNNHHQFIIERLKIVIIISSMALGFMIIVVTLCIMARYCQDKNPTSTERVEQRKPLNSPRPTNRTAKSSQINYDTRNFSRKSRTLPTAV